MSIEERRRKAEAGSCVAQTFVGMSYLYGVDVEVDYKAAFRFLSLAANQGASRAVLSLAYMYARGLGIPQDVPESIRLLVAVATPSDSSDAFAARIELGRIYSSGIGVAVDAENALKWYKSAIALATSDHEDPEELQEARDYVTRVGQG